MKVLVAQSRPALLQTHGLWPTRLLYPWDSPDKNTGVGCHFLLQGIFPTQGWNPGLLHCRQSLLSEPPRGAQESTLQKTEFQISEFKQLTHFSPIWWPRCVLEMWPVELQNWILHFIYVFLRNIFLSFFFFFLDWAIRHMGILVSWAGIDPAPGPPHIHTHRTGGAES